MSNKNFYYSINKLMSYNALFSFAMSERGLGKTFAGKKKMIEDFTKKGKQSIYVRRTATEMDSVKDTLFSDIAKHYPNLEITVKGYQGFINGECFCYFVPLSTSSKLKSASFPDVEFMFFDEYIITKNGRNNYLKNEMVLLLDLVETVFRLRRPRVYMCSNAVSFVNPFFSFFGIEPKPEDNFISAKDGLVVVELAKDYNFKDEKKKTDFAKLLEGTDYSKYAIDNETLEDTSDFIISNKPEGFNYFRGAFRIGHKIIGCWSEGALDTGVYFDEKYDKQSKWKYTVYSNQNFIGWKNIKIDRNHWNMKYIKDCFLDGRAYYKNQEIKKMFYEEISKYL